jgi:glutamate dehydrogenase
MTDEVAALVLRNNYLQTQALSAARAQAPALLDVHSRLIERLERDGGLDREIEFLPSKEAIEERAAAGRGLCEPELAVLLAYCKITLFQELLDSDLSGDPVLTGELVNYFPNPLRNDLRDEMPKHRLCKEIISTNLANSMVNRAGITFAFRLSEETGAGASDIARAYTAAREVFDMENLWAQIETLDNRVPAQTQTMMLLEARKLVERALRWLLRNRPRPLDVAAAVSYFTPGVSTLAGALGELVGSGSQEKLAADTDKLVAEGVPEALAKRVCGLDELFSALDIVAVATSTRLTVEEVAAVYFNLGARLELHWLRDQIVALPRENRWQALARAALRDDLYGQTSALTADVLRTESKEKDAESRIEAWLAKNWTPVALCRQVLADLKSAGTLDFAMLSVAMREIRALRQVEVPTTSLPDETRKPTVKRKRRTEAAA